MISGERQAARIRSLYLKTILQQDIAFYDKETNTGEVVGRMSGDTVLIQDAMGEKVLMLKSNSTKPFLVVHILHKKILCENRIALSILDVVSLTSAGREICTADGNIYRGLCHLIYQRLASHTCHVISHSSTCHIWWSDVRYPI